MAHQRAAVSMQTQPATVNTSMHFTPGKRKVVKPAPTSLCWRLLATRSQHSLFHTQQLSYTQIMHRHTHFPSHSHSSLSHTANPTNLAPPIFPAHHKNVLCLDADVPFAAKENWHSQSLQFRARQACQQNQGTTAGKKRNAGKSGINSLLKESFSHHTCSTSI